ncbi:MAG: hypothetical protein FWE05_02175 [Defluviitaleaceae bacterium]|nr:hypothetical protein [Defluviitaleaceae bacterium]
MMNELILQAHNLFKNCGFPYYICGGFALELFACKTMRTHSDLDVSVFQENKRDVVELLQKNGFAVYKRIFEPQSLGGVTPIADENDSKLDDIRIIWAIKGDCQFALKPREGAIDFYGFEILSNTQTDFSFIEIVLDEKNSHHFLLGKDKRILRKLDKAILFNDCGVPYMAPEVVLFLKSSKAYTTHEIHANKTPADFKAIMPLLSTESKAWLINAINATYPDGYEWLDGLL